MSQNCPNCGSPNRETNRFCSSCGTALIPNSTSDPSFVARSSAGDVGSASGASSESARTYVVQRWEGAPAPEVPGEQLPPLATRPVTAQSGIGSTALPSELFTQPTEQYSASTGYQGYTSGASARDTGTYVPYTDNAAKHLERQKSGRSWLVPIVAIAALVLVALALTSAYLISNASKASTPLSGAVGAEPPANASESDKIKYVVRRSNQEQIDAWHNLDPSVLKGTRIGDVLTENVDMVQKLKAQGLYAIPVNERLDILDVQVNGDTATAHTIEVWTVTFYNSADNTVVASKGPDTLTETYSLVKQNGKWLINKLDINTDQGTPTAR